MRQPSPGNLVMQRVVEGRRRVIEARIVQKLGIIRRAAWGARPPARALEYDWNYDSIVVHYSGHEYYPDMRSIQNFDLDHRHWDDMAYHYGITKNGTIYEGRELIYKGSHVNLQNTGKIGIVCIGDFDTSWRNLLEGHSYSADSVAPTMLNALAQLSTALMTVFPIRVFGGHREFGDTDVCPGSALLPAVQAMRNQLHLAAPVHQSK